MNQIIAKKKSIQFSRKTWLPVLSLIVAVSATGGALAMRWYSGTKELPTASTTHSPEARTKLVGQSNSGQEETLVKPEVTTVEFPEDQWATSKIKIEPARQSPFSKTVQLTGKITLNQDRIAHLYPMVEGAVESVSVNLGQIVKANDLLATIHSREVGDAKLALYQARLQLEMAHTKDRLQGEIAKNARELISSLRQNTPIQEIELAFRSRPMGDFRERALATYSNYIKSAADLSRLEGISETGAISGKQLMSAEANRNADQATFQSRIEQIEYELGTSVLLSQQAVKEADAKVLVASTSLRILGCDQQDIDRIDPLQQGETLSHYNVRAPFDGTVLTKDVVLREQVRPDVMLLSIADLSTVWITADIYEEHLPLLKSLTNQTVKIRNKALPDRLFEARVFYTGEIMDEATRTIALRAIADNPYRLLKPGMFITVELSGSEESDVLQVPASAIQEHAGQKFVFIHQQADKFERRDVKVGEANETTVIIRDGLQVNESIVTNGGFILKSRMLAELMGEE